MKGLADIDDYQQVYIAVAPMQQHDYAIRRNGEHSWEMTELTSNLAGPIKRKGTVLWSRHN